MIDEALDHVKTIHLRILAHKEKVNVKSELYHQQLAGEQLLYKTASRDTMYVYWDYGSRRLCRTTPRRT